MPFVSGFDDNPDYHRGASQVQRVREWRSKHEGYRRKKADRPPPPQADALQDLLILQGVDIKAVSTFRTLIKTEMSQPLQDLLSAQHAVICGLAATITGDALQDVIDGPWRSVARGEGDQECRYRNSAILDRLRQRLESITVEAHSNRMLNNVNKSQGTYTPAISGCAGPT